MIRANIILTDVFGDSEKIQSKVKFESVQDLQIELIKLQKGYTTEDSVKLRTFKTPKGNNGIEAFCNSDFSYVAIYKEIKKSKKEGD